MDKEKNDGIENNIDDILKHLKSTYENQDASLGGAKGTEDEKSENISPDDISERLRRQFMSDGEELSGFSDSEYDIDESLMSEFIEEAEKVETEKTETDEEKDGGLSQSEEITAEELSEEREGELTEETDESGKSPALSDTTELTAVEEEADNASEIVEIVIPIIDGVMSATNDPRAEIETDGDDNDDTEDDGDFYSEDGPESNFVLFADDEVNDDELFEDGEDEEVFVEEDGEKETLEIQDKPLVADAQSEEALDAVEEDLPWYTDDELLKASAFDENVTVDLAANIILPLNKEEIEIDEDAPDELEIAIDEALEAEEEEKEKLVEQSVSEAVTQETEDVPAVSDEQQPAYDTEESNEILVDDREENDALLVDGDVSENEEVLLSDSDEAAEINEADESKLQYNEEEKPAYSLFGGKNEQPQNAVQDEDDPISFYKTIVAARTEREHQYGYPITEPSNLSGVYEADFKPLDIEPVDKAFDEVCADSIPAEKRDEETFIESAQTEQTVGETNYDTVGEIDLGDYFDISERLEGEPFDLRDNEEIGTLLEFEDDYTEEVESVEKDRPKIFKMFRRVCMFALPAIILWLELMPILGIVPDGFLDYEAFRAVYVLIDAQLFLFVAALNYEKLLDGVKKMLSPMANFYSVLSVTVISTLLGSILSCFCMTDDVPRLYNFISAFYLLLSYLLEYFERRRKKEGTDILEKGDGVFTIRRSQGKNSSAEKMYSGGVDPDKSIFELVEIEEKSFYPAFSREKVEKNSNFSNGIIIGAITPAIIFGIIMAVLTMVFDRGLYMAFNTFSFGVVAISPVSAIVAYYLPLLISHKRLLSRGCVIAGYESARDVADCDVLIFNDTHLFKDCEAKDAGIKLFCDESKTRELFVCLACAYAKIGGPMKNTFSSVLGNESHKVSMIRIARNGFEAVIDNKNNLIVGSAEYLSRYGIYAEGGRDGKESGVIYVSLNSELSAKINVFYRTQPLFEALSEILDDNNVRSVIETYDPMITGKYVARVRDAFLSPISVIHKNINDYKAGSKGKYPLLRFGVFATASRLKLVELICFCKSLCKIRRINNVVLIGSYIFSCLLCISFVINGAIVNANMLWVLLYQLALMGIYAFSAIKLLPLSFEGMQEKKSREEQRKQKRENKNRYE